jgi:hypothetical protein
MFGALTMPRHTRRFAACETGSVTIEFVIWTPLVLYVGVAMFVLSYYLATASEVQQVAHEMARSSLGLVHVDEVEGDLCAAMEQVVLPRVVSRMAIVNIARFGRVENCPAVPDANGFLTVGVSYDLDDSTLHSLGRMIGFDFGPVVRVSTVQF